MNKFIYVVAALLFLILIRNVAAWEFDNTFEYDNATRTVRILNGFGWGHEIARLTLLTDPDIKITHGKERQIAKILLTVNPEDANYTDAFEQILIYRIKKSGQLKEISAPSRNPKLKYLSYFQEEVNDTYVNCSEMGYSIRGDEYRPTNCITLTLPSTHLETRENWTVFTQISELPSITNQTIGVYFKVKPKDHIEWVPHWFGVVLDVWATWTSNFNNGLVEYWPLDNSATGILYSTPGFYTMTPTYNLTGKLNQAAMNFSSNNFIQSKNISSTVLTNNITITAWIRPTTLGRFSYIITKGTSSTTGADYYLRIENTNYLTFGWYNAAWYDQIDTTTPIPANVYTFVAVSYHPVESLVMMYINGINVKNFSDSHLMVANNKNITIGDTADSSTYYFVGDLDEIGLWNRSLSASEISNLYNGGTGLSYPLSAGPNVSIWLPLNNYRSESGLVTFNWSAEDDSQIINTTLYINGVRNVSVNGESNDYVSVQTILNLAEGSYTWNAKAWDDSNNEATSIETRSITIDRTAPIVNITLPVNATYFLVDMAPYKVTINVTASDNILLNNCWYYNMTDNVSITCNNNVTANFSSGWNFITYYANDTLGHVADDSVSFFINPVNYSVGYSSTALEGINTTFYLNVSGYSIPSTSANLTFNNTVYPMNLISNNGSYAIFSRAVTIPEVITDINKQFWFNYTIADFLKGTSNYSIGILNFSLPLVTNGSNPCSPAAYKFTLQDEENFTLINGTFNYNFAYGSLSNTTALRLTGKLEATNQLYFCYNNTLGIDLYMGEGEIFYSGSGYVDRRYYIFDNSLLTANTNNVTLYDLVSSLQTSFKLEVEDTSLNPYSNIFTALIRYYPDLNQYNTVDMGKTDENGETVIHVRTEDVDYRTAVYYRNGTLIKLEDPTRFVCLVSPCTYTLKISPTDEDFTSFYDVEYTFTYNTTTGIWSFIYSDSSQKTTGMNLTIYKVTGTSVYSICSDSITGYVGALSCNTSIFSGTLKGVVVRSASPGIPIAQKIINVGSSAFSSSYGLWISLIIGIPIVFIFALISPIAAVIGGVIMLIPAYFFGAIGIAIVGGVAVLGGIVMHFLKRIG